MTLTERLAKTEDERHMPSNVVPLTDRPVRRAVPRWIEYTREQENRGKSLDQWSGDAA